MAVKVRGDAFYETALDLYKPRQSEAWLCPLSHQVEAFNPAMVRKVLKLGPGPRNDAHRPAHVPVVPTRTSVRRSRSRSRSSAALHSPGTPEAHGPGHLLPVLPSAHGISPALAASRPGLSEIRWEALACGGQRLRLGRRSTRPDSPTCRLAVAASYRFTGRLREAAGCTTIPPCRSTSFIVRSARGIARSWCARASGREPNVRTADQPSYPRSCPCSRPAARRVANRRRAAALATAVAAVAAAAADRIAIERAGVQSRPWRRSANPSS